MKELYSAAALAALTACGDLTKDPAEGLTFKAPAGWTAAPAMLDTHVFVAPDANGIIFLETRPIDANLDEEVLDTVNIRNARSVVHRDLKICGAMHARETRARVYFARTRSDAQLDMIAAPHAGETIAAIYLYPVSRYPDPIAEASIRELCPDGAVAR